jgi:HK97 family phage prohead protease
VSDKERRLLSSTDAVLRMVSGDEEKGLTLTGYAAVYDSPSEMIAGLFRETIAPGAFGSVMGDDVRLLVNHDGVALARTVSGTLRMTSDEVGLRVEADLDPRNPDVQRLRSAMERGDVDQMSFAFSVARDEWSPDWSQRRVLEVARLWDVSVVTYPAYPETSAAVRSLLEAANERPNDVAQGDQSHVWRNAHRRRRVEMLRTHYGIDPEEGNNG